MATTAPNPDFYIEWHDEGSSAGEWKGSAGTRQGYRGLSHWVLSATDLVYDFHLSTHQGEGHPYVVFATIAELTPGATVYGAKITMDPQPGEVCVLTNFTPLASLGFVANRLISDDPKIKISGSTTQPTSCQITWDGSAWIYSYDNQTWQTYVCAPAGSPPNTIDMSPDATGRCSVTVTDQTWANPPNWAAIYYQDASLGTQVGIVQSQAQLSGTAQTTLEITPVGDPFICTLNLFTALPSNQSTLRKG